MAGHGGIWLVLCVYRYTVGAGQHSRKEGNILMYDMRTQYTTAITRASQRPGACIACVRACVILLYYYIIILLHYRVIALFHYYVIALLPIPHHYPSTLG